MFKIGCHLSISKGFLKMCRTALEIGGNTCQFFSRNPRGGKAKKINEKDIEAARIFMQENHFAPLLAHAPYTLNACSADASIREFAQRIFKDDLAMLEYLPGTLYNFHPGSHVGQGVETGIKQITEILNQVLSEKQRTTVLLEGMSGKGSEIGSRFEELRQIIDGVEFSDKMGVCLDTCHLYSAGYDVVNHLDDVLEEFDRIVGLTRLKAIHLNDSMTTLGSHKDRHEKIGQGSIGVEAMERMINHPVLRDLPFYLETPNELSGYQEEIQLLRSLYQGESAFVENM